LILFQGQYQNSEKSDPSIFCDFEELKAPRRRPTQHKPKTETSIQTDIEEMASTSLSRGISPERTDDSTSAFPSVIPVRVATQYITNRKSVLHLYLALLVPPRLAGARLLR